MIGICAPWGMIERKTKFGPGCKALRCYSCSSDSTPSPGTSICCRYSCKKTFFKKLKIKKPLKMANIFKKIRFFLKLGDYVEFLHHLRKSVGHYLLKFKIYLPYHPVIPFISVQPRERFTYVHCFSYIFIYVYDSIHMYIYI